jgi:hypothetical protein
MDDKMVILPPSRTSTLGHSLIFLAGPIQGTWNWQKAAVTRLRTGGYREWIASPRSDTLSDGATLPAYDAQVEWEHFYLEKAGRKGVLLFWLAKEVDHDPARAYAQTSRFELGWTLGNMIRKPEIRLTLGIEKGFSGDRYIRKTFASVLPKFPITDTLEDTCVRALRLMRTT